MLNKRSCLLGILFLAACAGRAGVAPFPASADGTYRLGYSGVYGVGRVDLWLRDGKVGGLAAEAGAVAYRGVYRTARDGRNLKLFLIAHLPPFTSDVQGIAVVSTARDVPIEFELPAGLAPGARWPVHIETQQGPISGTVTRLD